MKITNLTYNLPLISAPKIHTDLLWDLSVLFIGITILYLIGIFFYRNKRKVVAAQVSKRRQELAPMISEFLFLEEDATKDEKSNYIALKIEIRQQLKDKFNRKIVSDILLDLRKDLAGETQKSLIDLYQDLGLDKDAYAKMNSWRWQTISKGIQELTQMQVVESYSFITQFINDRRTTIRKQAEIATVTLKSEGINYFMDTTKFKISEWQQLKLIDVLRNKENFQAPRFKAWLTSSNKFVVLFALRLIKYYNQNDTDNALIELVKHKNNQIKEEAISCIKEFNITEALPTLQLVFWNCSVHIKICILDTIGQLGTEAELDFLNQIDKKETNFAVRSKAVSSINAISPDSIMPTNGIKEEGYKTPADITEVVAKAHADKHLKLMGEDELNEGIDDGINIELEHNQVFDSKIQTEQQSLVEEKAQLESLEQNVLEEEVSLDFLPLVIDNASKTPTQNELENDENELDIDEQTTIKSAKEVQKNTPKRYSEFDDENLKFLPIVVENKKESIVESNQLSLKNISVISEEVSSEDIETKEEFDIENADALKSKTIQFDLDNTLAQEEHQEHTNYTEYRRLEILNCAVTFEEITASEETLESVIANITVFEAQEVTASVESKAYKDVTYKVTSSTNLEEKLRWYQQPAFAKFVEMLLKLEDEPIKEAHLFQDSEVFNIDWKLEGEDLETDLSNTTSINIPAAIFDDIDFNASTRQLLNDLDEMGDIRDVPFIQELLQDSKYAFFTRRLEQLIVKFSDDSIVEVLDDTIQPFSVFKDLFRSCDTDSRLILMDEILAVGDEKDIDFVKELLEDPESRIREKANQIINPLLAKLQLASSTSDNPTSKQIAISEEKDAYDIFAWNFIYDIEQTDKDKSTSLPEETRAYGSFLSQLYNLTGKFLERFNG